MYLRMGINMTWQEFQQQPQTVREDMATLYRQERWLKAINEDNEQ